MSEFLAEEDPDPHPGYAENHQTGLRYEGYELSDDLKRREAVYLERVAIGALIIEADRVLSTYVVEGDYEDSRVYADNVLLRRRRVDDPWPDGRARQASLYFFVDRRDGGNYCRTWCSESSEVGWCYEESRHEPAADVAAHIREVFPVVSREAESDCSRLQRVGAQIMRLLGR